MTHALAQQGLLPRLYEVADDDGAPVDRQGLVFRLGRKVLESERQKSPILELRRDLGEPDPDQTLVDPRRGLRQGPLVVVGRTDQRPLFPPRLAQMKGRGAR